MTNDNPYLPCPFCGSADIDPTFWLNGDGTSGPGCGQCGATGEADGWNRRALDVEAREKLAHYAHNAWSGWMLYLFQFGTENADGSFTIRPDKVARWKRQAETRYADLPESEKDSDRIEADTILAVLNTTTRDASRATTADAEPAEGEA